MKTLYGLLGEKLSHSLSPEIHSSVFKEMGIDGCYHLFEVDKENLQDAVKGLKALKVKGVNVTIPYKIEVMKYLDHISEEGKSIGAINTIVFKDGETFGYNTDYYGFGMTLKKFNIKVKDNEAVILGSGGAAKAVVQYLLDNGAKDITFATRNVEECKRKFKGFNAVSYDELRQLKDKGILINCTPVGMYPNVGRSPISKEEVVKFKAVVDLIYNPKETLLLKYAREEKTKAVNGLYMLIGQGIKAEELWHDIKIKSEMVDKIYEQFMCK